LLPLEDHADKHNSVMPVGATTVGEIGGLFGGEASLIPQVSLDLGVKSSLAVNAVDSYATLSSLPEDTFLHTWANSSHTSTWQSSEHGYFGPFSEIDPTFLQLSPSLCDVLFHT